MLCAQREIEFTSLTWEYCSLSNQNQERIETNGDGVKPGSPHARHGGANVQLGQVRPSLNIFSGSPPKVFSVGLSPVPVCFGVIRALIQHPLGGCGVLKREIGCTSRGECYSPSSPSGFPPPLGIGDNPPKMRDMFFVLFDKVLVSHRDNRAANRTNRTSLAGRGRRLDAHEARVYLTPHLACEVAKRAATCKRRLCRRIMTRALPSSPAS